jgi:hypothetical protein
MSIARRNVLAWLVTGALPCFNLRAEAATPTYKPDPSIEPLLGGLANQIAQASRIPAPFVHSPAFLGTLPADDKGKRLLVFDTAFELDTDGWAGDKGNPNWQPETSLRYGDNGSLDANHVPYFVLPLPPAWPTQFGISLGDYAAVLFQGRLAFAVFGDRGPRNKLGEGSVELLRRLGQERVRPNGHVINAGTRPGVLTIVFPGSGAMADRADQKTLLRAIDTKGRALFVAAGGSPAE